jgi:dTDP-4-dehydrorhamnose reductase
VTTVTVLGATGMLGSMIARVLSNERDIRVVATAREAPEASSAVEWRHLDARTADVDEVTQAIGGSEWVINAIGVIKQRIDESDSASIKDAVQVNAVFPHHIVEAAAKAGSRVIQIATDCVYSGQKGNYVESDPHDPLDVYGKSKSLGEIRSDNLENLRCSIVGPEKGSPVSLLGWFLSQPHGRAVPGFTNHRWNGITTFHFAKICLGLIRNQRPHMSTRHVVPGSSADKAELLSMFARALGRDDLTITPAEAPEMIDRTLATNSPEDNSRLWRDAGYQEPPSLEAMIDELAQVVRTG